jgi:hypothetical protein
LFPRALSDRPDQRTQGDQLVANTGVSLLLGLPAVQRRAVNVGQVIGDLANRVDVPCRELACRNQPLVD